MLGFLPLWRARACAYRRLKCSAPSHLFPAGSSEVGALIGGDQVDAFIAADMLAFSGGEVVLLHRLGEAFSRADFLVIALGPCLPGIPQAVADAPMLLPGDAAFVDPAREAVLFGEVRLSCGDDGGGWGQADSLPFQAAVDGPLQYSIPLCLELFCEVYVSLFAGIVTVKGTRWKRLRIASSTLERLGLWLPTIISLNLGVKSKKSPRM